MKVTINGKKPKGIKDWAAVVIMTLTISAVIVISLVSIVLIIASPVILLIWLLIR